MTVLYRLIAIILLAVSGYYAYIFHSEYMVAATVVGFLAGFFFMYSFIRLLKKQIKSYKREVERKDIVENESSSRVEVLESKIEVLEKALKSALENQQ